MESDNSTDYDTTQTGISYPQDFSLEKVDILTTYGETIKIKHMVTELSFFEDIYSFVVSGYIILVDAVGLIEKLKLTGNEYLRLVYGKSREQSDSEKNTNIYRIYKVGQKRPIGNNTSDFFTLYFCSEQLLLSEQNKISKSYKSGKQIATEKNSDPADRGIINDILENQLQVSPNKIAKIEETYGIYNFIIPRLKPLEAISWLSTYARPKNTEFKGADMLFFQTNDGFYFRSLQSMYKDDVYATYKYQSKNTNAVGTKNALIEGIRSVLDIEYVKAFDVLHDTGSGTYANRLVSIDPFTKRYKITNFNYNDYASNSVQLNENPIIGPGKNKLGEKQTEAYNGTFKVFISNPNQQDVGYIKDSPGSVAKDIYAETFIPFRTAQLSLANYTVLKLLVPGDSAITAGKTINLNIFSSAPDANGNRILDEYFSGKYLVTAVRHIIQASGNYQTILEIAKESLKTQVITPDSTSAAQQRVINEAY